MTTTTCQKGGERERGHHLGVYGLGGDGRSLVVRHGAGGGREGGEGRSWLAKVASGGTGRRRGGMDEQRREREGDLMAGEAAQLCAGSSAPGGGLGGARPRLRAGPRLRVWALGPV